MVPTSIEDYLRSYADDLSYRILAALPPLHSPKDPVSPILGTLKRRAFPAQALTVMAAVKRLREARSVAVIGEMGTGKTFMAMSIAHVSADGKPYAALVVAPGTLIEKWCRELLQTIPGARVYVVDSLRTMRPGQTGPQGVNEVRLRNGRIIRDGLHTTLTDMRLRGKYKTPWERWVAEHGPGPHFVVIGRDRAKLGAFWKPSFQIARCGNYTGAVVNPDSGRPVIVDDCRLLRQDFDKPKRYAEELSTIALCGEETKPRKRIHSPLWQADGKRIRRYAPIEFIGKHLKNFFRYGILDEVHEAKASDTAQGNSLGKLAAAVEKTIVLTGTLTGGMASDVFNILFRIDAKRMLAQGYEYGDAGLRPFAESYGVLETITTIEPQDNACSKARVTKQVKQRPGASPLLFARFLMDLAAFVSLDDISANLPPYTEGVITVGMDPPLAKAYADLERQITDALREHRGNSSVISTALNALLLFPDKPFNLGQLWGSEYNRESGRREPFRIAEPADLAENVLYAKERRLIELVQEEAENHRGVQIYATYTQKRDVTRRLETILSQAGIKVAVLTAQTPPEQREAWYERQIKAGVQAFIGHPRLVQTGLDLIFCPAIIWYQTGYSTFTLRQASRRSWRIGQTKPVSVRFLCYDQTAQIGCLRLMGKKLLVSMALEGKFADSELQSLDEGDDILTSLARELVMNRRVGESAEAVWRDLRVQSAILHRAHDPEPAAEAVPLTLPEVGPVSEPAFGQTIAPLRKRPSSPSPAEQLTLF